LLSIFHYVLSGLTALFGLLPIIHITMGIALVGGRFGGRSPPPSEFGWVFIGVGVMLLLGAMGFAVLLFLAARFLRKHRHWTYCMVVAGLSCAFFPFGTVLGVFSIVTLSKPEAKALVAPPLAPDPTAA
jgi:hypothetical protein